MFLAMVDSGLQETLISHQLYGKIKCPVDYKVPALPTSDLTIVGVTGELYKPL